MIVLQLLRKQRASLWSFCPGNCSRRPMGDAAAFTTVGKRLQNSCLNFADARLAVLDLTVAYENLDAFASFLFLPKLQTQRGAQ